MLKLDTKQATAADNLSAPINQAGKYVGTITRAERLQSDKGTKGLGLSFKADNGQTADYLDLYHTNNLNEPLVSAKAVNAIMACLKLTEAQEGPVSCEKWSKAKGSREKVTITGYPAMMGKRIGFLFRITKETDQNGKDRDRVEIFGVFNAETELTASEILARATKPEKLPRMLDALMARPVIDKRDDKRDRRGAAPASNGRDDPFGDMMPPPADDDCPF